MVLSARSAVSAVHSSSTCVRAHRAKMCGFIVPREEDAGDIYEIGEGVAHAGTAREEGSCCNYDGAAVARMDGKWLNHFYYVYGLPQARDKMVDSNGARQNINN